MHSLQHFSKLIVITSCLFAAGVSCTQADGEKKIPNASSSEMNPSSSNANQTMNPMMMGQMSGMMNPHMYMNMMAQMSGMMNPQMMNPQMMNPMMMGGGMMNPMMGMNMMYPMMGAMGPMMGPMSGGMGMPGMSANNGNAMTQMPGGKMMDPKQYEQWFNQMTEMMKNNPTHMQPQANQ